MSMKSTWLLYSFLGVVLVKHKTLQFFFSSSCPENLKKVVGVASGDEVGKVRITIAISPFRES